MLEHRMTLVCVRLFRKNLGNLQEFFGQMVHRPPPPPRQNIARTPMTVVLQSCMNIVITYFLSNKRPGAYYKFQPKRRALIGRRALNRGGCLLNFSKRLEVTGPRRLENGLVVPGKSAASTTTAAIGQK